MLMNLIKDQPITQVAHFRSHNSKHKQNKKQKIVDLRVVSPLKISAEPYILYHKDSSQ